MLPWVLALGLGVGPGPSQPHTRGPIATAIGLEAGASCLALPRLVTQVEQTLGRRDVDERVRVEVVGDPDHAQTIAFTVRTRGEVVAERKFDPGPDKCEDLHAVVGVAIALAIDATDPGPGDPVVPVAPVPAPVAPPAAPTEPIETPPETEAPPAPRPKPKPVGVLVSLELGPRITIGAPPGVGGGGIVVAEFMFRERFDLRFGAIAQSSGRADVGDGEAVMSLFAGLIDGCIGQRFGRIRPRLCVGLRAGAAVAQGREFRFDGQTAVPWVAPALSSALRVRLVPRVALDFGVEGTVSAVRPAFETITPDGRLEVGRRYPVVAGAGAISLVIALGRV